MKSALLGFLDAVKRYRGRFLAVACAMFAVAGVDIFLPWALRLYIDAVGRSENGRLVLAAGPCGIFAAAVAAHRPEHRQGGLLGPLWQKLYPPSDAVPTSWWTGE